MTLRTLLPSALAALALASGVAQAQIGIPGGYRAPTPDTKGNKFNIKRKTVSGTIKTLDTEKKLLVLDSAKSKESKQIPVDVGPAIIHAGKGRAVFADLKQGDKISVYGEVTIQGGIRAMELTVPAERMTIPPPTKVKVEKKAKSAGSDSGKEGSGEKK